MVTSWSGDWVAVLGFPAPSVFFSTTRDGVTGVENCESGKVNSNGGSAAVGHSQVSHIIEQGHEG